VEYLALTPKIRLTGKNLQRKHSSLFCSSAGDDEETRFVRLTPGANVIKLFCQLFIDFLNKLECLSLASFSSLV
jgi:hypothetical protein